MDVILVVPPHNINERMGLPYPMGLGYLGTILKRHGHHAKIIDCDAQRIGFAGLRSILIKEKPVLVGVTAASCSRFAAIKVVNLAKKVLPDVYTVAGGPHFTATAEDALRMINNLDFIIRGEGEISLLGLIKAIEDKQDFRTVLGLSFRDNNEIIHNKDRSPIKDLDSQSVLDRGLIEEANYFEKLPHSNIECKSVLASRGCPYGCTFCFPHDRTYRRRSIANVLDEIEDILNNSNIKAIRFFDLTLTANSENIINLCQEIKRRRLNFLWYCESRVDINLDLLEVMKNAGCYAIDFGLESASEKVLKSINKKITLAQAMAFAKKCKDLGIKTRALLMLSLPEEEIKDAENTYAFAQELSKYTSEIGIEVTKIIPGTELEKRAKALHILDAGFSWNSPYNSNLSKMLKGNTTIPIYIEKLPINYIKDIYKRYSIFSLYQEQSLDWRALGKKVWRAVTVWDKGIFFKMRWLILFVRFLFKNKEIRKDV